MIGNFFSRRRPDMPPPQIPPGRRVYAVGDIHGCLGLLRKLHRLVLEHAETEPFNTRNAIIYLGDYVDRGDDSRGVIELLLNEPLPDFEHIYLKGNHEESLLRFLADRHHGAQWFGYGGDATLQSYGIRATDAGELADSEAVQRAFAQNLPPEHLAFFNRLRLSHIEGDYLFVHAGVRPGVALNDQDEGDMLWIRDEFLRSNTDFGKVVVHGHSIANAPTVKHNRIGIDTGAFASGCLTCLVLEGTSRRFLTT